MIDATPKLELNDDLDRRVKRLAEAQNRNPQHVLEDAVSEYDKRAELRDAFRQDALASDRHFSETGLHLNADDMEAWLDSWAMPTRLIRRLATSDRNQRRASNALQRFGKN